jgi:peptide/nickel transport system permease protein
MARKKKQQNNESLNNNVEGLTGEAESLFSIYKRRFKKHTFGKVGLVILVILYTLALFADFFSPYSMTWTNKYKSYHPPSKINLTYEDQGKTEFRPFVYEKWQVNVAQKKYGVVPPYTMRAISFEPIADDRELRSVAVDKNRAVRKETLLEDIAGHYNLPEGHAALQRISGVIDELERDPRSDVRRVVTVVNRRVEGEQRELKLQLVKGNKNFIGFFNKGIKYGFLGLFETRIHFFGSPTGGFFPMGTDKLGRGLLSRLLHGSRVSLSVGLLGVLVSFVFGLLVGGASGYFGGKVDTVLMRIVEVFVVFPTLYLLLTLRAAFPPNLDSVQVYLLIVLIVSLFGWARLSRVIRGLVLSLKEEDFVMSARTQGLTHWKIIRRHILPNTLSFVIVQATLTIPGYILGESALSLLGLGITEPQSSWGLMLSVARNYRVAVDFPWILIPGFAIFIAIMAWNFFGDGIRDAVDPKSRH